MIFLFPLALLCLRECEINYLLHIRRIFDAYEICEIVRDCSIQPIQRTLTVPRPLYRHTAHTASLAIQYTAHTPYSSRRRPSDSTLQIVQDPAKYRTPFLRDGDPFSQLSNTTQHELDLHAHASQRSCQRWGPLHVQATVLISFAAGELRARVPWRSCPQRLIANGK